MREQEGERKRKREGERKIVRRLWFVDCRPPLAFLKDAIT